MHHIPASLALAIVFLLAGCSETPQPGQAHDVHDTPPTQLTQTQGSHDSHGHDDHAHDQHDAVNVLTLNDGKKWETDEALRQAMQGILELLQPHLNSHAIGDDFAHLAQGVHDNIEYMVQNCKLEPQADAVLHAIIGEMVAGASLLQGEQEEARGQGVEQIIHALNSYSEYFDHPGFTVPHAAH